MRRILRCKKPAPVRVTEKGRELGNVLPVQKTKNTFQHTIAKPLVISALLLCRMVTYEEFPHPTVGIFTFFFSRMATTRVTKMKEEKY